MLVNLSKKILSYVLGGIFIFSGIAKLLSIDLFSIEISEYITEYLPLLSPFISWRMELSYVICFGELLIGAFSIFSNNKVMTVILLSVTSFFLYLTAANYMNPPPYGMIESCGCFGEFIKFSAKASFYKSVVLWLLAVINAILAYMAVKLTNKNDSINHVPI
jgi:hypothetical protein